jgi:hypothetical protein
MRNKILYIASTLPLPVHRKHRMEGAAREGSALVQHVPDAPAGRVPKGKTGGLKNAV